MGIKKFGISSLTIKGAKNKPAAIYFIDESFTQAALKSNGVYTQYRYPSYVCTLKGAMAANNVSWPVYTILAASIVNSSENINEIRYQMPASGCAAPTKSTLDWIGIDDYKNMNTPDEIFAAYNTVSPAKWSNMPKWVLVPPATTWNDVNPKFNNNDTYEPLAKPVADV